MAAMPVPGCRARQPPGRNCPPLYAALTMPADSRPMRIDAKAPAATAGAAALQRRPAAGRGFMVTDEPAAAKTSAATASAPLATVDALLAVQGEGDPAERRRRSVKRGHDLLDALDRLKAALLSNRLPAADLQRIARTLAERRDLTDDPRSEESREGNECRCRR